MSEWELCMRILIAAGFGLALGVEREAFHKPAGLRTHLIVCVASALLTTGSLALGEKIGARGEALRVAAGVVTGIGFIGAGVILQTSGRVHGLTTAATVFMSAALGITVGSGFYWLAATAAVLTIVANVGLGHLESRLEDKTEEPALEGEPHPRRLGRPASPRPDPGP
jgi:putative Mg2+ transporter-C (MgtC) family protein